MTYVQTERAAYPALDIPRSGAAAQTTRQRRLERLADILEEHDNSVQLLSRMEYTPSQQRYDLREDQSPLSLAFQDLRFREEGLSIDRLGDIMNFFQLSDGEAHHLLCYCHYSGRVTSKMVAERARELARKKTLGQMWHAFWARLSGAPALS